MVDFVDILRALPVASAATWFTLAALQVYRDRYHTWTETFFLFACIFAGLYATFDSLFFWAETEEIARSAALASFASAIVTSMFLFMFTLVYIDRMRRVYWVFAAVTGGTVILYWLLGLASVSRPERLWIPRFNTPVLLVILAVILGFSVGGIVNLYRLHKIVRASSPQLARRTRGFLVVFALVIILGLGTNGILGALEVPIPPPFSTLSLVIAAATIYTLYPGSTQRVSEAVRRFQSRRYAIKAVFLTFEDGTLIGSKARPGETAIDQDLFGATLDVIQNFMRTSFPILRGKSLSSISHGNYTLVVERARRAYMTVVLEGEETDQLRRQMRDVLLQFEETNKVVLANWRGIPTEAKGTDELLNLFFAEAPML
jgi:hypothetical protein